MFDFKDLLSKSIIVYVIIKELNLQRYYKEVQDISIYDSCVQIESWDMYDVFGQPSEYDMESVGSNTVL